MTLRFEAKHSIGGFEYEAAFDATDEIVVLFGHSGAGKSMSLKFVAGLVSPDEGRIEIDGRPVFDSREGVDVSPQRRRTGYVVQDLALFPHMTVAGNVAFGMERGLGRDKRVSELLTLMHLGGMEERAIESLSGGQRQRVALARALGRNANVLLLDEPFSALDESLRADMRRELLRLRSELGLSVIFVTHDLREAHLLADRLAVFDEGKLLQFAPREEVFRRPTSRRVAELTGVANILRARVAGIDGGRVRLEAGGLVLDAPFAPAIGTEAGTEVDVAIRAELVNLRRLESTEEGENLVRARLTEEFAYGSTHTLHFEAEGLEQPLVVEIAARPYGVLRVATQREWLLELPAADLHTMKVVASTTV